MIRPLSLLALVSPLVALAHEGHGQPGSSHWHATDVVMFIGVGLAAAIWLRLRK